MSHPHLKHGCLPTPPDERDLKLASYLDHATLPPIPTYWGFDQAVPKGQFGMLGNDQVGDCVFAAAAHQVMVHSAAATGTPIPFTDEGVISDYSAVTGYVPGDPSTDQGTDLRTSLAYRHKTGIIDATGKRHKIGAYLRLDPTDTRGLATAGYLFGSVIVALEVTELAYTEYDHGTMWTWSKTAQGDGLHCVPLIAHREHLEIITWGKVQTMSAGYWQHYYSDAWVVVSPEFLNGEGQTPEGFNLAQLNADLSQLHSIP
jgi:hypothetical protein